MDKAKHNADLVAILRQLKSKGDQMEVIKVLNGLQALDRIPGYEVLDYVKGFVQVKQDDPEFSFADYMEMAQMGSEQTMKEIMAKPGPKSAKPAPEHVTINKADLKSVSIQLGFSQMLPPLDEIVMPEIPVDIKNAKTIEVPPPEPLTKITMKGTVTQHLGSQNRYSPTSNKDMGGGMGSVIPYKDKALDREVIRKKPKTMDEDGNTLDLESLADDLAVFEREMRISGTLVHANIPPVYEAGIDKKDGTPYFDMLKIVGKPLNDLIDTIRKDRRKIQDAKEFDLQRRVQIFADIARAMAYAHTKKIIHRDLKPGNVMIGDNKVTYVIDWGLAKHLDDKEDAKLGGKAKSQKELVNSVVNKEEMYKTQGEGTIKGTLSYMSPEQARADNIDEKSDQYTLGTILYELATLEDFRPFLVRTQLEKVIMIGKGTYPFTAPRKMRPDTPAELESIILKSTQFDKRRRYASVQQMLNDVEAYLTGGYVSAHDYGFVETFAKRVKNNPIKTVAGGLAAIALAGIVSVYGVMSGRVAHNELLAAQEKIARELAQKDAKVKDAEAKAKDAEAKAAVEEAKRKGAELALANEREKGQKEGQKFVFEGDRLIKDKGDFEGAIAEYSKAIEKEKTWNEPYFKRGLAEYSLFRASKAIDDFIIANEMSEKTAGISDTRALFYAGWVNMDLLDRLKDSKHTFNFPAGVDFFKKLASKASDKNVGYVKLARSIAAFDEYQFDNAYQLALEADSENPRMWEAKCLLAQYEMEFITSPFNVPQMRKFRNYKQAFERIDDALENEKDQIRCLILKPQLLLAIGQYTEASAECEKLIRIRPDIPNFHYFKAMAHQHANEFDKCLDELNIAERLDTPLNNQGAPLRSEILTLRGLMRFGKKDYDIAEKDLTDAIANKDWAQSYSYRGVVRAEKPQPNLEGALQDHNKAIQLNPDWGQAYSNRGRCEEAMNNNDVAITDYKKSVSLGYSVGLLQLGSIYYKMGKNTDAADSLETYLKDPNNRQQRDLAEQLLKKIKGK